MICTHDASRYLDHAPIPCEICGGWVDRDGSVLDAETAAARYPELAVLIVRSSSQVCAVCYGTGRGSKGGPCPYCNGTGRRIHRTGWRAAAFTTWAALGALAAIAWVIIGFAAFAALVYVLFVVL